MTEEKVSFIEFIYCACGCGKTKSKYQFNQNGYPRKDRVTKYIHGHFWRGKKIPNYPTADKHPSWKGGRTIADEYVKVRCVEHPKSTKLGHYVAEHILMMEKHLGRYLTSNEEVHHIDHNPQNNQISNLQLMTSSEHTILHLRERRKEIEKRRCNYCGQKTRLYRKDKSGYKSAIWIRNGDGWLCGTCWRRFYSRKKRLEIKRLAAERLTAETA